MEYDFIKQKLISILNSNKTKNFFREYFCKLPINNSIPILNFLLENVFEEHNVLLNFNNGIHDLLINDKKILVRLHSFNTTNKRISIKNFKVQCEEDFLIEEVIDEVNCEINNYDYIFLIRVEEEKLLKIKGNIDLVFITILYQWIFI